MNNYTNHYHDDKISYELGDCFISCIYKNGTWDCQKFAEKKDANEFIKNYEMTKIVRINCLKALFNNKLKFDKNED
jgi:hypothetical protein